MAPEGELIVMDNFRGKMHKGLTFTMNDLQEDVDMGVTNDYLLRVNANECHTRAIIRTDALFEVELFETPNVSDPGSARSTFDRNRISANDSTVSFFLNPTLVSPGVSIFRGFVGEGMGGNTTGDALGGFTETIFAPNTDVCLRLTNVSGQNNKMFTLTVLYYETVPQS